MGVWAFFDRSRNISSEQSRIPGKLWQWRQCLCIHGSNVQLLDPVNWWEGFPLFCYQGATRRRSCESEFSFFGRSSRFSEQVKKQHQLLLSAWFAMDGTMDVSCLQSTSQSYLQVLGGWWHQSQHVHRRECSGSIVIPYRVILREMKTASSSGRFTCKLSLSVLLLAALFAYRRWFWTCFCIYLAICKEDYLSQYLSFSSRFEQKKAKDSYHLDFYSSSV